MIPSTNVLSLVFVIPSGKGRGKFAVPPAIVNKKSAKLSSPMPKAVLKTGSLRFTVTLALLDAISIDLIIGSALSIRLVELIACSVFAMLSAAS